jgi:hypothetical protein
MSVKKNMYMYRKNLGHLMQQNLEHILIAKFVFVNA